MQTWCDILNTPISQVSLALDELTGLSSVQCLANTTFLHSVSTTFTSTIISPHTIVLSIHNIHLQSVVHWVLMLLRRIRTLHLRSVIHQVLMLLYHIHTRHLHYMATHHIHILLPQLVVRQVVLLLKHIHTLHL
jgi:hypothetical protein